VKWREHAAKEHPRVVRELGIPCAEPVRVTGMTSCPRHGELLGKVSRMCLSCRTEAWDEVGRRYASAEQSRPVDPQPSGPKEVTMSSTELVEGELPEVYEPVEVTARAPITLFGTSDPRVALERMSEVASALVDVIKDRKLYARISGHEHITAEGWTTLGGMLGIVPVVVWTRPNETDDGYVARVEARTLDGRVVGAAESECSRAERRWKTAEGYAIRSMAQTRAIGRALRAPLGQIVVLAGYEPAGAEEVSFSDRALVSDEPRPGRPTGEQIAELRYLVARLQRAAPEQDWKRYCRTRARVPPGELTDKVALDLIGSLREELARLGGTGSADLAIT
jgi:hypothetical protein